MKITFFGAAHEVTGSCTLLEVSGRKYLIDCGMEQGADIYENCELSVSPSEINAVFVTHAHIDHSGKLPLLVKNGFAGKIYASSATGKLCSVMLADSAHIQQTEAIWKNRRAKRAGNEEYVPMYTPEDVINTMKLFDTSLTGKETTESECLSFSFFDEGHLLGSSGIKMKLTENGVTKTVVFSGDVGNKEKPLLCDPVPPTQADYVVIESTYGDREHEAVPTDNEARLADIIKYTLSKNGNLIIPSFAVGRTQELLYMIRHIKEKHAVPFDFPVWIDSPLAVEATNIYSTDMRDYYDDEALSLLDRGINPITFDGLHVSVTSDDSKALNIDQEPKIIISASGMCEAGRIRHHLKYNLWKPECTVLFVGYQVEGTLGRRILDGASYVNLFGQDVKVNARIEKLEGISAHADKPGLISWLSRIETPGVTVFVNHGDDKVCDSFAKYVGERLGFKALAPYSGGSYDLISGDELAQGNRTQLVKKKASGDGLRNNEVWSRLYFRRAPSYGALSN